MSIPKIGAKSNRLAEIMESIVDSYDEAKPKVHHLDQMPLPSREDVARIMEAIEEIIYPGYYSAGGVTHQGIFYRVQERIGWLFEHLCDQVQEPAPSARQRSRSLRHLRRASRRVHLCVLGIDSKRSPDARQRHPGRLRWRPRRPMH